MVTKLLRSRRTGQRLLPVLLAILLTGCSVHREAGTGDLAFRLLWQGRSDLDLSVEDPRGTCVFYGSRRAASGGLLDVDCNAGTDRMCERPIENVFWSRGTAPPGRYRFWVHAHALLPAEAPLHFEVQLLAGSDVVWRRRGVVVEHDQLFGPFVHRFPNGAGVVEAAAVAPPVHCTHLFRWRVTPGPSE